MKTIDGATGRTMTFDPETTEVLRVYYKQAVAEGKESFVFAGNELLTAYAGYLLEYLDSKFKGE